MNRLISRGCQSGSIGQGSLGGPGGLGFPGGPGGPDGLDRPGGQSGQGGQRLLICGHCLIDKHTHTWMIFRFKLQVRQSKCNQAIFTGPALLWLVTAAVASNGDIACKKKTSHC